MCVCKSWQQYYSDFMFVHACVAKSESLCVCLAKQCCTALIRPGKWLLFSLTARAVYRAFENYILWRGSDLTWRVKSTAKNRSTSFRQINATAPDVRTDWIVVGVYQYKGIKANKPLNRPRVLHRTLKVRKWLCRLIIHANLQQERRDFRDHRCRKLQELSSGFSYPWHSEGHAEVLATLQPEAPRRRAAEGYWVYVHSLGKEKRENRVLISHHTNELFYLLCFLVSGVFRLEPNS